MVYVSCSAKCCMGSTYSGLGTPGPHPLGDRKQVGRGPQCGAGDKTIEPIENGPKKTFPDLLIQVISHPDRHLESHCRTNQLSKIRVARGGRAADTSA